MHILEIGYQTMLETEQTVFHPDGLEGTLLLLTYAPMKLEIGGMTLHSEAGDAVIISEKTALRYAPAEHDLLYDWVLFDAGTKTAYDRALRTVCAGNAEEDE